MNFIGKHLYKSLFFNNVLRLQTKEKFYQIFQNTFFTKHLYLTASALFCLLCRHQPQKNVSACSCTKKDTFHWSFPGTIFVCEYFFIFYFFVSEKIDICLIVKVFLLRRIKLLNSNVNKKKKHAWKFDVRCHANQELLEIDV